MIHIVYRTYKAITDNKPRPAWFSKEKCFNSIANPIINNPLFKLHILFNGESEDYRKRPELQRFSSYFIEANNAAESYLEAIGFISNNLPLKDYVYLVEDDYLHHPDWANILFNMTKLETYFTLYDHPDKYVKSLYNLTFDIVSINDVSVRLTPSTTDTFCVPIWMLMEDHREHVIFSKDTDYSKDHQRFICLGDKGRKLYSSIPGYSVHCHEPWCNVRQDYFD